MVLSNGKHVRFMPSEWETGEWKTLPPDSKSQRWVQWEPCGWWVQVAVGAMQWAGAWPKFWRFVVCSERRRWRHIWSSDFGLLPAPRPSESWVGAGLLCFFEASSHPAKLLQSRMYGLSPQPLVGLLTGVLLPWRHGVLEGRQRLLWSTADCKLGYFRGRRVLLPWSRGLSPVPRCMGQLCGLRQLHVGNLWRQPGRNRIPQVTRRALSHRSERRLVFRQYAQFPWLPVAAPHAAVSNTVGRRSSPCDIPGYLSAPNHFASTFLDTNREGLECSLDAGEGWRFGPSIHPWSRHFSGRRWHGCCARISKKRQLPAFSAQRRSA